MSEILIRTIRKSDREELRLSVAEYHGHTFLNVRACYRSSDGEMRPSRKGVTVPMRGLPAFCEAAALTMQEAERLGYIEPGKAAPPPKAEAVE